MQVLLAQLNHRTYRESLVEVLSDAWGTAMLGFLFEHPAYFVAWCGVVSRMIEFLFIVQMLLCFIRYDGMGVGALASASLHLARIHVYHRPASGLGSFLRILVGSLHAHHSKILVGEKDVALPDNPM